MSPWIVAAVLLAAGIAARGASSPTGGRVALLGDSHSTVEAGMGAALTRAWGRPVELRRFAIVGRTMADAARGTAGAGPFAAQLPALVAYRPAVVLVAFGTNEAAGWSTATESRMVAGMGTLAAYLRRQLPGVRVVFLGPPAGKLQALPQVREAQGRAAAALGCTWIDRAALMAPESLGGDGVHLTPAGYAALARSVAGRLATTNPHALQSEEFQIKVMTLESKAQKVGKTPGRRAIGAPPVTYLEEAP